jgi:predicted chitinase
MNLPPEFKDDFLSITKRINGGTNGLSDRKKYLDRAKTAIPA